MKASGRQIKFSVLTISCILLNNATIKNRRFEESRVF